MKYQIQLVITYTWCRKTHARMTMSTMTPFENNPNIMHANLTRLLVVAQLIKSKSNVLQTTNLVLRYYSNKTKRQAFQSFNVAPRQQSGLEQNVELVLAGSQSCFTLRHPLIHRQKLLRSLPTSRPLLLPPLTGSTASGDDVSMGTMPKQQRRCCWSNPRPLATTNEADRVQPRTVLVLELLLLVVAVRVRRVNLVQQSRQQQELQRMIAVGGGGGGLGLLTVDSDVSWVSCITCRRQLASFTLLMGAPVALLI